jgi:hypothetical protein
MRRAFLPGFLVADGRYAHTGVQPFLHTWPDAVPVKEVTQTAGAVRDMILTG